MSASNSTRTELRSLREVAHFLLPLLCCEFCHKPLLDKGDKIFGDKVHSPLKTLKLTVHHRNGKHRDNHRKDCLAQMMLGGDGPSPNELKVDMQYAICGNTSLVHRPCHSEFEMKANHHKRKVMKVKPLWQRAKELLINFTDFKLLSSYKISERYFITSMFEVVKEKGKVTRYEIRRLKKLAAKSKEK